MTEAMIEVRLENPRILRVFRGGGSEHARFNSGAMRNHQAA